MWRTDRRTDRQTDRQTDGPNCDSICALSIYAVARKRHIFHLYNTQHISQWPRQVSTHTNTHTYYHIIPYDKTTQPWKQQQQQQQTTALNICISRCPMIATVDKQCVIDKINNSNHDNVLFIKICCINTDMFLIADNIIINFYTDINDWTGNILDCDQSNYSSRIIFTCIPPKLLCNSWKWIG